MVSAEEACLLALELDETVEQDHHGRRSFRTRGKIFATLWDDRHMNVMLDEDGIHTAVQGMPETCEEVWWGKRLRAARVSLDAVASNTLRELLRDAWERHADRS